MLVALGLAMVVVATSCSPKDKDQARQAVQQIEDKTKEAAEDAAEKTKKAAADVANKGKEVVSATGEAITDTWITTKVKAKFADDKLLKNSQINVETNDRVVKLKGTVVSDEAKKRALMIASGTEGVLRVADELSVKAK
jgi:hyperosmotically inducible protein